MSHYTQDKRIPDSFMLNGKDSRLLSNSNDTCYNSCIFRIKIDLIHILNITINHLTHTHGLNTQCKYGGLTVCTKKMFWKKAKLQEVSTACSSQPMTNQIYIKLYIQP